MGRRDAGRGIRGGGHGEKDAGRGLWTKGFQDKDQGRGAWGWGGERVTGLDEGGGLRKGMGEGTVGIRM